MQICQIWRFLEKHMTRTLQHSKKKKSAVHSLLVTKADLWAAFSLSGMFTLVVMLGLSVVP